MGRNVVVVTAARPTNEAEERRTTAAELLDEKARTAEDNMVIAAIAMVSKRQGSFICSPH